MHQSIIGTLNMLKLEKKKGQAKCAGVLAWLEVRAARCEIFLIAPQAGRVFGLGLGEVVLKIP